MESFNRAGLQQQQAVAGGCGGGGGGGGGGWVLVEARLQGGAPWGFTLQGGLEHGQPLIISKVEEGGKADCLEQPLLVGDEILSINEVDLTGFRQEAIALVKGSYKTLQLTVRREFDPGYMEEFETSHPSLPELPSSPPPLSSSSPLPPPQQTPPPSRHSRSGSAGGVQLRIKNRRNEASSRPHSWHSTKLGEGQQESNQRGMDTVSSGWHHSYHASASNTDLSGGFDAGSSYLRKSPDQYSSRGSMESLDPPQSSHLHPGAQHHHHPLGHHTHGGPHPAYSSCHQLSSARSSNSIDHLHSKRDSAYSSFSTSSSIPEYLASNPSFSPERSYSLETVPQRGGGSGEMQQADIRYVRTVYDNHQGSQEHELSSTSAALLRHTDPRSREGSRAGMSRDMQGSVGVVCYRGSSSGSSSGSSNGGVPASNRHSVGPILGPTASSSSYESLKGAPAPPRRSDSYAAIRHHERPNSWSSLEQPRSLRLLQKGSWHHSSGPVASAKGSYGTEGQLHTVIEKSPESSPTIKPRQGGGFSQPPSPTGPSTGPAGPPNAPSGRFILPTGMYPVPQPEPRYAQTPSTGPAPGSAGVYPTLAKESSRQREERGVVEGRRDGRMSSTENGYQNNTSSTYAYSSSSSSSASSEPRTQAHQAERPQREESNFEPYRPCMKTARGASESQTESHRVQNHQGAHIQSLQGSHVQRGQLFQEQIQDFHSSHIQSTPGPRPPPSSQEWREPVTPVQSRADRSRSTDQIIIHSEEATSPRLAQGQVPPTHIPAHPQPQSSAPSSTTQPNPTHRHLSDSAALQHPHWDNRKRDRDREHPLTRLEIALAEVQRSPTPTDSVVSASSQGNSSHGNSSLGDGSQGPARSLSVLEKVNRFERRERSSKQRSLSTANCHLKMTEKGQSNACGASDLRSMLERSTSGRQAHRTMSYLGGSNEHMKYRTPADPSSALQRSRSTFQLDEYRDSDGSSKHFPWRQDIQEMLGSMQDTSSNRSYRDSLKDAQSKVLQSTSFRPISSSSSGSPQPPPVSAKYHSLEKKAPKTMPKPQGVVIAPQSPQHILSPHTPKERHVVSLELRGPSPPALPSMPPVGPPARICARKRLGADQKKRSYSEPEKMHEVGVSDAETAPLRRGETSVADRRKMFELVASHVRGAAGQSATSRPDLRQIQHDALAEYVERKRSVTRDDGGHRGGPRPRSAYLQPENSNHTVSSSQSDTFSLSSASSLLSLQDSGLDRSFSTGERDPGADLRSLQSNLFYPGRVTTPRLPANPQPSILLSGPHSEFQAHTLQDLTPEEGLFRQGQSSSRDPGPAVVHQQQQQLAQDPQPKLGLSTQLNGALQRAGSSRKSASAEDLLERSEERPTTTQHYRSLSTPMVETINQDYPPGQARVFGVFSELGRDSPPQDRPSYTLSSGDIISPQHSQHSPNTVQPAAASQDPGSSQTPVTRRERQRTSERQRVISASTLAASVGLPCPFSPPRAQEGGSTEWYASERLSQANLDSITFPDIPPSSAGRGCDETRSLGDGSILEDPTDDVYRVRAFSLGMRGVDSGEENSKRVSPATPTTNMEDSPSSPTDPSIRQGLFSLRISESSLGTSDHQQQQYPLETSVSKEDFDDVFFQNPPPPSPPPPIKETTILEDFPPPPPELEEKAGQTVERFSRSMEFLNNSMVPTVKSSLHSAPTSPSSSSFPPPVPSFLPTQKPQPSSITSVTASTVPEDSLGLEYQPLHKREKTSEELRVEALARQLLLQDHSLAPLLDTWGSKSTVELMEEVFQNSQLLGKSPWQRRRSSQWANRIQDGVCVPAQTESDVDEEEKDLDTRKMDLCEALRLSVAALRQEKEALCEEQRLHQALGAGMETLIQEHLKPNEREKYIMFIGDLEKIVNLLLSLCSRLSRMERSLLALEREDMTREGSVEERDSLHHKRSMLLAQTEDAVELKENLERRQRVVGSVLSRCLTGPQLQDYRRYVSSKPSLLVRQRHLDELVRQAEEQLLRLAESLPQELTQARGWSRGSLLSSSGPIASSSPFPPLLPPSVSPSPSSPSVKPTTVTSL